jgi:alpha-L-fucosidase
MKSILGFICASLALVSCNPSGDQDGSSAGVLDPGAKASDSATNSSTTKTTAKVSDTLAVVPAAKALATTCPLNTDAASIKASHTVPAWLQKAHFGIQIHFGLYSVTATHNEWDPRYFYCNSSIHDAIVAKFPGMTGMKDVIPKFATNFDATAWAKLFKQSGADWVQITAEHHDHFALWNTAFGKWNSYDMGPKRDIVGELAGAVRSYGMKFGVSNHIMYGYSFFWCGANADKTVDLYDPAYADYYGDWNNPPGPPNGGCDISSNGGICQSGEPNQAFLDNWEGRAKELWDKYQVDVEWFDWDGANSANAMKSKYGFAGYYYQQACLAGKDVAIIGKGGVYPSDNTATGANIMVQDFETGGNAPAKGSEPKCFWVVDDKIGSASWGYIDGLTYRSESSIESQIDDYYSRGGVLILNVSPMGDGTIPQAQQTILQDIGKHYGANQNPLPTTTSLAPRPI